MGCVSRLNLCPASGDTENLLLQKILQSLNAGVGVTSVNGNSGPEVLLTTSDIPEGTNLYFTDARVIAATTGVYLLKAGDTGTGAFIFTPSAANTTPLTLNNSLTGASAAPTLAVNSTWSTTGAPTAFRINATSTASAAASLLFDAQLNSVTVLNLRRDGRLVLNGRISATDISGVGSTFVALNATTSSMPTALILQHNLSSGVPVAGFGVTADWNLDSTTTVGTLAARMLTNWTDPAHATRTSAQIFQQQLAGVLTTSLTITNGQIQGAAGTAALPTFTFVSDPNTGIFSVGADSLGFSTGGVVRLTIADALATLTTAFQQNDTTALGVDPTSAVSQQSVLGEWQYRSSAANEGAGQLNRVHNRALLVVGAGTDYTLTTTLADVVFGTTSPVVVLPTAGTYLVMASVQYLSDGAGAADVVPVILWNQTDASSAGLGGSKVMTAAAGVISESAMLQAVVTITATKTFTIRANNSTAARGTIISTRTNISFVRLS